MSTIFQALTWADKTLKAALSPVQQPKIDAQALLAFVLDKGTAYLFAHGDDVLLDDKDAEFRALVLRRAAHEPVAYLVGKKEFYGRPFLVTQDVLIPRPDTETLVDAAKTLITDRTLVIDVGTGSGAVAVTLALESHRPVVAIDESSEAIVIAKNNATANGAESIAFLEGNLLTPLFAESEGETLATHVVIVANLPYLSALQYDALDPDVQHYEPTRALVSGIDGLDHYDALFAQIALRRNALPHALDVVIEIDQSQKLSAPGLIRKYFPIAKITVINDLAGRPRVVVASL